MIAVQDVSVFTPDNKVVACHGSGALTLTGDGSSLSTRLVLPGASATDVTTRQEYYAIGRTVSGAPFRTETVPCADITNGIELSGVVTREAPSGHPTTAVSLTADESDMLIKYTNYSPVQFNIGISGANLQDGFGALTHSPGPVLLASSGQQSIGASQRISWLAEGPADVWLEWINPANGVKFGVWIHFNFQFAGMGPRPIWYVTTNGSPMAPSGADPSAPFTWDRSQTGLNIIASPTSGPSSLEVDVTITAVK